MGFAPEPIEGLNDSDPVSIKFQKTGLILAYFSPKRPILEFSQTCGLHRMTEANLSKFYFDVHVFFS